MHIQGRVALVTGASRGIGRGLVRVLAEDGARLALVARDPGRLDEVAASLAGTGAEVLALAGDVGDDEDARRMVGAAEERFGRVDMLVNNAAVLLTRGPLVDLPAEEWAETLRVNVLGTVNMIRHVLPGMEQRGDGVILNLSSGWGRFADADVGPYCASKFAVEAISQSLAKEVVPGVTVFALNPGVVATDMLATAFGGDVSAYPTPESLAPRWRRLLADVQPDWNGTSLDLQPGSSMNAG